jgi:predicted Rossmann fold nucleotide-binding protein DprA/Smf involved in DNA uptake
MAVVSGAARGVDTTAMIGSTDAGGTAIGVVADALEKMTRRRELREHILEGTVLLLSAYHPSAPFSVGNAMRRNRLIYCLADVAIVVASGTEGGTRSGALENLKAAWVPLFVRADNGSDGNRDLLKRGGIPLNVADLEGAPLQQVLLAETIARPEQLSVEAPFPEPIQSAQLSDVTADSQRSTEVGDIFRHVWPLLAEFLKDERSEKEVAETFALETSQARAWLKRAVREGLAERVETRRRYRLRDEGLFSNGNPPG